MAKNKNGTWKELVKRAFATAVVALMGSLAPLAQATVLLERPLNNPAGGWFSNASSPTGHQRVANSFTLAADATVTGVHWWGHFLLPSSDIDNDFRIRFYSSNATTSTIPGTLIHEQTVAPTLADTGLISTANGSAVWEFTVDPIPQLSLLANETYWLEIAYLPTNFSFDQWIWSRSNSSGDIAARNLDTENWTPNVGGVNSLNLAFYLTGTFANSIPEPATLALMSLSLAGIGFARRRRLH